MSKKFRAQTLGEFIVQQQIAFPYATGYLSGEEIRPESIHQRTPFFVGTPRWQKKWRNS